MHLSHILLSGCERLILKYLGSTFLNTFFYLFLQGGSVNTYSLANWRQKMQCFHFFLPKMWHCFPPPASSFIWWVCWPHVRPSFLGEPRETVEPDHECAALCFPLGPIDTTPCLKHVRVRFIAGWLGWKGLCASFRPAVVFSCGLLVKWSWLLGSSGEKPAGDHYYR